jgi:hypothetical protein
MNYLAPVRFYEDLPEDAPDGSVCAVNEGAIHGGCAFMRVAGKWVGESTEWVDYLSRAATPSGPGAIRLSHGVVYRNASDTAGPAPPEPQPDRLRRRPVVCGGCGAPVAPSAERCEHCGAWMEGGSERGRP